MNDKIVNSQKSSSHFDLFKIFVFIGGAFVFLGIAFFVGLNWSMLSKFTKLFSTLGVSIAAYLIALMLHFTKKQDTLSSVFFMIAGLVLPLGLYFTFDIYQILTFELYRTAVITGLCFLIFIISYHLFKKTTLLFFTILFASLFYISLSDVFLYYSNYYFWDIHTYIYIMLGLSYVLLGRYLDLENKPSLVGPLYFFGALFILGGTYFLDLPLLAIFFDKWKLHFLLILLLSIIISVPLRSKSFLYIAALFILIYIGEMSQKLVDLFGHYGWPLFLVLLGFLFIILGYVVLLTHRKINQSKNN